MFIQSVNFTSKIHSSLFHPSKPFKFQIEDMENGKSDFIEVEFERTN